jgi:hypothetical protein
MKCSELITVLQQYMDEDGDHEVEMMYIDLDDGDAFEEVHHVSQSKFELNGKEMTTCLICTAAVN